MYGAGGGKVVAIWGRLWQGGGYTGQTVLDVQADGGKVVAIQGRWW